MYIKQLWLRPIDEGAGGGSTSWLKGRGGGPQDSWSMWGGGGEKEKKGKKRRGESKKRI